MIDIEKIIVGANPTASVGLTTVNGVAGTFMRSDAAPALSQSITPTWTGLHVFAPTSMAIGSNQPVRIAPTGFDFATTFKTSASAAYWGFSVAMDADDADGDAYGVLRGGIITVNNWDDTLGVRLAPSAGQGCGLKIGYTDYKDDAWDGLLVV